MVRICLDARMLNNSGIGTYIKNLIIPIAKKYEIILIGDEQAIRKVIKDVRCRIIHSVIPIYSLREQFEMPLLIPKCEVFISPHYNIPLLPINAKKRIATIHDVFHLAHFNELSFIQKIYAKVLTNAAVLYSNKVLTVSEFSKKEIVKYTSVSIAKLNVIHLGIDTLLFRKIDDNSLKETLKVKVNLPDKFILFVGNVKPNKNLKILLEALLININEIGNLELVIVGKKDGFITGDNEIAKFLNDNSVLDRIVRFTGYLEDEYIALLYNMAEFLVFPSLYEGFGFPPLEAMACGCATLVSNAASIPEICGDASLYFDPKSAQELSEAIKKMSSNEKYKLELVERGYVNVEKYKWEIASQKMLSVIDSLI